MYPDNFLVFLHPTLLPLTFTPPLGSFFFNHPSIQSIASIIAIYVCSKLISQLYSAMIADFFSKTGRRWIQVQVDDLIVILRDVGVAF